MDTQTEPTPARRALLPDLLGWAVIALVTIGIVGYALYRPGANSDLIFYAATVHQWDGLDTVAIHDASLADARDHLAPEVYAAMTTENDYMRTVVADPEALVQQIPFYSVKVLYPALMIALRSIGIPLGFGQLLISLVSYLALGFLVYAWLRRRLPTWLATIAGALIIVSPPWSELARIQSPDALGALMGVAGLFLILELRRPNIGLAVLVLSILARPNAVVMAVTVALALAVLVRSHPLRLSWPRAVAWAAAAIGVAALLIVVSGNYGMGTLFYHAVVEYLPYPARGTPSVPLAEIIRIYAFKVATLWATPIPLFGLLGVIAIGLHFAGGRSLRASAPALVVVALLVTIVAGFVTYPLEAGRILAMPFLGIALLLATSRPTGARWGTEPETAPG